MNKKTYCYLKKDKSLPCPSGDRLQVVNTVVRDGNNLILKKTGVVDIVEKIQSYRDGVELTKMIERYKRGDASALSHGAGFYADVSGFSDDPLEVINQTRDLSKMSKNKVDQNSSDGSDPVLKSNQNVQNEQKEVDDNA